MMRPGLNNVNILKNCSQALQKFRSISSCTVVRATQNDNVFHITQPIKTKDHPDHLERNIPTETNRLEKTHERFWEKVTLGNTRKGSQESSDYVILLDGKPIKTPAGNPLVIPSQKPSLAQLTAHEWTVLPSLKIKPHLVPLTSLASRAIDLAWTEHGNLSRIDSAALENIVEALLPYLDTDTLLVFAPYRDCEGKLRPAQEKEYRPLISKAEKFWTDSSKSSKPMSLNWLDSETMGFSLNKQSSETKEAVSQWIRSLDTWKLVALERATMSAKSLIIGMLVATGNISVPEAVRAATLETIYQTELWGEVQDSHDVDFHDMQRTLASAYILGSDK
ncbi:uncharacterized protein SAPINGB_P005665 [Magnusiomyces paraingens]|uniref:ATP synthase mitochondrial F1 complex assembly factor 2 n=1 Tax=Magnusiomyces paraingens TaxID=2606893 RepID=A0A5E8C163_9ASCO|nr:uncharacterized protein SAPINGB_P005665 [Saprochaete ingens]VVT57377.1 unnamed protein product [Saprochaete ingens]